MNQPLIVKRVERSDPAFANVVRLAVDDPASDDATSDARLESLLDERDPAPLGQGLVFGAFCGTKLRAAALAEESFGYAALVFSGAAENSDDVESAAGHCLRSLRQAARDTTLSMLEALVSTGDDTAKKALRFAGFSYLTRLVYFIKSTQNSTTSAISPTNLTWITYSDRTREHFRAALDQSYQGSRDCPELAGLRKTEEVLLGHRPRNGFDPSLWLVAQRNGQPVGVLLLNSLRPQSALEIAYVGVSPNARGEGVSDALMARTLVEARRCGVEFITLAVDTRNKPALDLYTRWSFERCLERDAWIALKEAHDLG